MAKGVHCFAHLKNDVRAVLPFLNKVLGGFVYTQEPPSLMLKNYGKLIAMSQTNQPKVKILFLCTGNSCRSQMAEGWAKILKADTIEAYSGGIEKHGLNLLAVKAMAEVGVDISSQQSKIIDELPLQKFDWIITLCSHANESCPYFPGKKVHHGFDDPPQLALHAKTDEEKLVYYRRVRDEIRQLIESLPESL